MPSFLSRFSSKASKDKLRAANSSPKPASSAAFSPSLSLDLPSPNFGSNRHTDATLTQPAATSPANAIRRPVDGSGGGALSGASSQWVKVKYDAAQVERDRARVAQAVLGLAETQVLLDKCGGVIRDHGLTTLGLFRPYRLSESQREILKLELLFLGWATDGQQHRAQNDDDDLFAPVIASKPKEEKLERFESELKFAHIHDVVAVLKWALRHLVLNPSLSAADATTPPLEWLTSLGPSPDFGAIQASLPGPSQAFLLSTVRLIEGVAAYTESNAMPVRKLCRSMGLYVLGLCPPSKKWPNWEQLYESWARAGDALELIFKAYLRSQSKLPPRLQEVLEAVPSGRLTRVARVDVTSSGDWHKRNLPSNDQQTGLVSGSAGFAGPRQPLEILVAAFATSPIDASCDDDELLAAWTMLSHRGQVDPKAVLSDELRRVLELVKLDSLQAPVGTTLSSPNRRRSASHDELVTRASHFNRQPLGPLSEESPVKANGAVAPASPLEAHFPNKSLANLSSPAATEQEPSWADFASSGFGSSTSLSEGLHVPKDEPLGRAKTLSARTGTRYGQGQGQGQDKERVPVSTLESVRWFEVEEELADCWLDTLVETSARGAFSPFVLAELAKAQGPLIEHLLVVEQLVPFPSLPGIERSSSTGSGLRRAASIADSTMSRRWKSRASSIFGGKDRSRPTSPLASPNISPVKQRSVRNKPSNQSVLHEAAEEDAAGAGLVRTLSRSLSRKRSLSKPFPAMPSSAVVAAADAPPVPKLSMDVSSLPASPVKAKSYEEAVAEEASRSASINRKLEDSFAPVPPPLALDKDLPAVGHEHEDEDYNEQADSSVVDESVLAAAGVGDAASAALLRKVLAEERASLKSPVIEYNEDEPINDATHDEPEPEPEQVEPVAAVADEQVPAAENGVVPHKEQVVAPVAVAAAVEPTDELEQAEAVETVEAVEAETADEPAAEMHQFAPEEPLAAHERRSSVDTVKPTDDVPVEVAEPDTVVAAVVQEPAVSERPATPPGTVASPISEHLSTPLARSGSQGSAKSASPSSGRKKLLKGVGSFLSRKSPKSSPSALDKDKAAKAHAKALAEKEEAKALQKVELQKKALEQKQAPAPVSSVRKRVLELEAEARAAEEKKLALIAARGAGSPVVLTGNNSQINSRPGTPTPPSAALGGELPVPTQPAPVARSLPSQNPSEHSLVSESEPGGERSFRTAVESDIGDDESARHV